MPSRKIETKKCLNCTVEFTCPPSTHNSRLTGRMFCGQPCAIRFRRRTRHGIGHKPEVQAVIDASELQPSKEIDSWNPVSTPQAAKYRSEDYTRSELQELKRQLWLRG